jgi:hypothetical protein
MFESPSRSIDTALFTGERHAKHAPTILLATTNPTKRHENLPSILPGPTIMGNSAYVMQLNDVATILIDVAENLESIK